MLTKADEENYGSEFIDLARRAAIDALSPELHQLRTENQHLRQLAQRSQTANIQAALDRELPGWRATYADPDFADWLSAPDDYSAATRSQLLRHAVANGDASRVAAIYRGFQREAHAPAGHQRAAQSRPAATGGRPIYSREQIKQLYEQRRLGQINDAKWGPLEADIFAAGREGRVVGALNLSDGTALSRLR
jgi:hypothetical protein